MHSNVDGTQRVTPAGTLRALAHQAGESGATPADAPAVLRPASFNDRATARAKSAEPAGPEEAAPHRGREAACARWETAFGYARDFLTNRFVYVVVSPRAHGLSVGINMNPDKRCNFDCVYCEVNRSTPPREQHLDVPVMVRELQQTLALVRDGRLQGVSSLRSLPEELLRLRHVTLSGDGEPTLCPNFSDAVHGVLHVRALGDLPFFRVVLVSNATGLDLPEVQKGLNALTHDDEIWLKLDGGTAGYIEQVDRPQVPLEKVLENILSLGRQRPIIIQSLFPKLAGQEPPEEEIAAYVSRLRELKDKGAQIALVQVYSAMRPTMHPDCRHLPLKTLSRIAHAVRDATGLRAEVF
jgi:wyosine [tRNA(Phe)-imidazoG37] synthetase (radical SAM superfamily)